MGRILETGARRACLLGLMALAGCGGPLLGVQPGAVAVTVFDANSQAFKDAVRVQATAVVEASLALWRQDLEGEAQAAVVAVRNDMKAEWRKEMQAASDQRGRTNISIGQIDGGTLVLAIGGGVLGIYLLRDTIKGGAFLKRLLGRNSRAQEPPKP